MIYPLAFRRPIGTTKTVGGHLQPIIEPCMHPMHPQTENGTMRRGTMTCIMEKECIEKQ